MDSRPINQVINVKELQDSDQLNPIRHQHRNDNENASYHNDLDLQSPYFLTASQASSKKTFPSWLTHFNSRDLKTLFKCSVAVWIYSLFILINPTLSELGSATFFGCIALFIAPPSGIVLVNLMAAMTLLLGMCLAWAWGVITMKAALAARPQADLDTRLKQLQESIPRNTTSSQQAASAQIAIFNGFLLDTRVTITYFCMICLFVYFIARIRVIAPKLVLTEIFGIVVSDIFLTTGPLLPSFSGELPQLLIKPAAVATGVGLACNILFFPQSTSHVALDGMHGLLAPMNGYLEASLLSLKNPSERMNLKHLMEVKSQIVGAHQALGLSMKLLPLDASRGKWSAEDISTLKDPLRQLVVMFLGLLQLQISREEVRTHDEQLVCMIEALHNEKDEKASREVGHHHLNKAADFRVSAREPQAKELIEKTLLSLAESCGSLFHTCQHCIVAINEGLRESNTSRWFHRSSATQVTAMRDRHASLLDELEKAKESFITPTNEALWAIHGHIFDEEGHPQLNSRLGTIAPVTGFMMGQIYEERILNFATALHSLLARVVELETQRTSSKFWLPTGLQRLGHWILEKEPAPGATVSSGHGDNDSPPQYASGEDHEKQTPSKVSKHRRGKEDQAEPVENSAEEKLASITFRRGPQRKGFGKILVRTTSWLGNSGGLYAMRVVIVTIALGLPAVFPSSAGFFYREKGLWAIIMAQTSVLQYTADFVFGFGLKMIGTILGGVIGMVCWYIGAGNGLGEPYGMAAIVAVAIVPLMYGRLFAPLAALQGILSAAATMYLVMAYSWVDTHIPSYGNPGLGYSVFWRRTLLVIVGFTTAALVTFIPRPPSANRHYRRLMALRIDSIKHRYALFACSLKNPASDLLKVAEKEALASSDVLLSIIGPIQLVRLEFSRDPFDAKTLASVCHLCMTLNQNVTQLLYTTRLPETLRFRFASGTGALDERLVADVMAVLTLVQLSLKTGEPLPAVLPTPLLARCFGLTRSRIEHDITQDVIVTRQLMEEEGFREYCSALTSFVQMLGTIDELVMVVKRAVGETGNIDFEQ